MENEININAYDLKLDLTGLDDQISILLQKIESARNGKNLPQPLMVTLPCGKIDIIDWLAEQDQTPKIYWSGRNEDQEIGCVGSMLTISENDPKLIKEKYDFIEAIIQDSPVEQPLRFFGCSNFNSQVTTEQDWSGFPTFWFVLPQILVQRTKKKYQISISVLIQPGQSTKEIRKKIVREIEKVKIPELAVENVNNGTLLDRLDQPDYVGWKKNINHILDLIKSNGLQKVVLARKSTLSFSQEVSWKSILYKLKENNENCFTFLFQLLEKSVFLGATPERIFRIDQNVLISEAVSGTSPRKATKDDDLQSGINLLKSDKNVREHRFVSDDIQKIFENLCKNSSQQPSPSLLKLSNVQHLYTKVVGQLKKETSVYEIISAMHPTPAVGGTPRKEATTTIQELEPFERGWYAGPIGYISKEFTEMAVALRSLLIEGNQVHLFAGAGIIEGSEPDLEWQELESKISLALATLEDRIS